MIRPAEPHEAALLTDLAVRAKAHWGYDERFMAIAARDLLIHPEQVRRDPFHVLEVDGTVVGFHGLRGRPPTLVLEYLFVTPERIGRGHGRELWEHAVAAARASGARALELDAEPHAEAFYRARGARRVGWTASPVPGRRLPRMRAHVS